MKSTAQHSLSLEDSLFVMQINPTPKISVFVCHRGKIIYSLSTACHIYSYLLHSTKESERKVSRNAACYSLCWSETSQPSCLWRMMSLRHLFWHFCLLVNWIAAVAGKIGILLSFYDEKVFSSQTSFAIFIGDLVWRLRNIRAHNLFGNHSFTNQSNWLPCSNRLHAHPWDAVSSPKCLVSEHTYSFERARDKGKIASKNNSEIYSQSFQVRQRWDCWNFFISPNTHECHVAASLYWLMADRKRVSGWIIAGSLVRFQSVKSLSQTIFVEFHFRCSSLSRIHTYTRESRWEDSKWNCWLFAV